MGNKKKISFSTKSKAATLKLKTNRNYVYEGGCPLLNTSLFTLQFLGSLKKTPRSLRYSF
jgi:hypothetical protein